MLILALLANVCLVVGVAIVVNSFILTVTFKFFNWHLSKDELKLGFYLALKYHGVIFGITGLSHFVAGLALIFGLTFSPLLGTLLGFLAIFGYGASVILSIKLMMDWFELNLGELIIVWLIEAFVSYIIYSGLSAILEGV